MSVLWTLIVFAAATEPAPHRLDGIMVHLSSACLLPDMAAQNPNEYFAANGWRQAGDVWTSRLSDANISVSVKWPGTMADFPSCSLSTQDIQAVEFYDWFKARIGDPNNHAWTQSEQAGIWWIKLSGRQKGIYLSRDRTAPSSALSGTLIHILERADDQ